MTSVSKNGYFNKLDNIVNEYDNKYHKTVKMMLSQTHILTLVKKLIMKILNLKLVIMLGYQNIKTFLQKAIFQIGLKKFLWLRKLKMMYREHMLLKILVEKKLLELFMEKNCKNKSK